MRNALEILLETLKGFWYEAALQTLISYFAVMTIQDRQKSLPIVNLHVMFSLAKLPPVPDFQWISYSLDLLHAMQRKSFKFIVATT